MLLGKIFHFKYKTLFFLLRQIKAFTIIEVITVMAILSMSIFVLISIFPYGLRKGKSAEYTTIATNLAQAKIEELISTNYDSLTVGTSSEPTLVNLDNDFALFSRTITIYYLTENFTTSLADNDLKKIKVIVSWFDPQKQSTSSISLSSIIANQ